MTERVASPASSHGEQSLQVARLQEHDIRRMALRRQEAEFGILSDMEMVVIRAMRTAMASRHDMPTDDSVVPGAHFEGDFGGKHV